jgi:transposase-like protein
LIRRLFEIAMSNEQEHPEPGTHNAAMLETVRQVSAPCGTPPQPESMPGEEVKALLGANINEQQLSEVWNSPLAWKLWALLLYLQGVSTAAIGGWLGVNKSTICRWLDQVATWTCCLKNRKVESSDKVAVDEKWILIDGVFWYLFAAVDCLTGCPLHVALYPSNDGNYCKLFLLELKRLGYHPTVIITDGWDAYVQAILEIFPHAEHLYCRFHALQSLFRRLRKAYIFSAQVFKLVCKLFKSPYKRTAQRRCEKLQNLLERLDAGHVLSGLLTKWPKLLKTVGSARLPSTANAVERFFGAFDRLYRLKGPFCDQDSAQKHLQLFLLGYFLTIGQQGQPCPLEKAGVDVSRMPIYHLLNRPNVVALKERMAAQYRRAA